MSGSIALTVSGEGLTGESPVPVSVTYSGDALLNRVVTAAPIVLGNGAPSGSGRFMASQSVGGASALTTTGDDQDYTRITVNGTLFNSATTTSSYTLAAGTYTAGPVSGSIALTVSGEGLTGESPVPVSVAYSGNALLNRVVTAAPIVLGNGAPSGSGRFMAGQSISGTSTLTTTGDAQDYTRITVNGTLFNSATTSSSYTLAAGTYTAGPVAGSIALTVSGEGLAGESPVPVSVTYSGDALLNRVVTAAPIVLGNGAPSGSGRFMASQSVGGTSSLSTTGDDQDYTRISVNGTLFNSATSSSNYTLSAGTYAAGPVAGSIALAVSGEGLAGESPVPVSVTYSGDALLNRVVTAAPIVLGNGAPSGSGRFMASQSVGGTEPLTTTGDDQEYTRITVNGTLFNSATASSNYTLSAGTYAAGAVAGSIPLTVSGEGLAGESPVPVSVTYSGDAVLDRVVTAAPIVLGNGAPSGSGRFMAGLSTSGTSALSTTGDDQHYTRITVNGTLFNSATASGSYTLSAGTFAAGPVSGSVSLAVSGEGLAGENPVPVSVAYSGDAVLNRIVTSTSASFGLIHLGQSISLPITLSTTGLDNQYTRVSVNNAGPDSNGLAVAGGANPVFNGPAVSDSRALAGVPAVAGLVSGTILLATSGEGLTGESPVPVQVAYSGQVFSGNALWSGGAGNTSWGVNANWSDTSAAGVHATPGTWGLTGDGATLAGAITVTLDGPSPSLASLTFNNTAAGYGLAAGSGGTLHMNGGSAAAAVTVAAGSPTLSAPLVLDGATNVAVSNSSGTLTISGPVSGSGGLTMTGSGTLLLAGASTYTGSTTISAGGVQVAANASLAPGTGNLAVNGGTLTVDPGGLVDVNAINETSGAVNLNGGTIRANTASGSRGITFNSGTLEYKGSLNVAANDWLAKTLRRVAHDRLRPATPGGRHDDSQRPADPQRRHFFHRLALEPPFRVPLCQRDVQPHERQLEHQLERAAGQLPDLGRVSCGQGGERDQQREHRAGREPHHAGRRVLGRRAHQQRDDRHQRRHRPGQRALDKRPRRRGPRLQQRSTHFYRRQQREPGNHSGEQRRNDRVHRRPGQRGALGSGGQITGNGNLLVNGGLLNSGTMSLSAGNNIGGAVTNGPGAMISTAGGTTTFMDSVVNNGTVYTGNGAVTVFYGAVSGSGGFTGPGLAEFESNVSTGQVPSAITVAGQATFDSASQLNLVLAGTAAGTQYDQVKVAGAANLLGGSLSVTLAGGFRPAQDQQFTVLTSSALNGAFAAGTGLDLGGRLEIGARLQRQQRSADGRAGRFGGLEARQRRRRIAVHELDGRPSQRRGRRGHLRAGHHPAANGDHRPANRLWPDCARQSPGLHLKRQRRQHADLGQFGQWGHDRRRRRAAGHRRAGRSGRQPRGRRALCTHGRRQRVDAGPGRFQRH